MMKKIIATILLLVAIFSVGAFAEGHVASPSSRDLAECIVVLDNEMEGAYSVYILYDTVNEVEYIVFATPNGVTMTPRIMKEAA